MPVQNKMDATGAYYVVNNAAVDPASHGAVGSVDTVIAVRSPDGSDLAPLQLNDLITNVILPATFIAGVAVQTATVTSTSTITLRTTNGSAAPIDPPSMAAGTIKFTLLRF